MGGQRENRSDSYWGDKPNWWEYKPGPGRKTPDAAAFRDINPMTGKPFATPEGHQAIREGGGMEELNKVYAEQAEMEPAARGQQEPENILEFIAMILGIPYGGK